MQAGPYLGVVRSQGTVISHGAPTALYPNYINNFTKTVLNAFRIIDILQPLYFYFFYKFGGP